MNNAETISFLGWTDEVTACDLCGKSELKSTAALEIDGAVVYFGCVCAAKALAGRTSEKLTAAKIKRLTENAHDAQIECGKAFDKGLNWERDQAAERELIDFRNFLRDAGREFAARTDLSPEQRNAVDYHMKGTDGAFSLGRFFAFASMAEARAAFAASKGGK